MSMPTALKASAETPGELAVCAVAGGLHRRFRIWGRDDRGPHGLQKPVLRSEPG